MASETASLLPSDLDARFRYLCQSRTVNGSLQAKCYFLHEGKEYSGILFSPDGEEWFEHLEEGTLVKATRVGPCQDERYMGEYKGTALPIAQQHLEAVAAKPVINQIIIDIADMPNVLREAAGMIEVLLAAINKQHIDQVEDKTETLPPAFRSWSEWANVVRQVIRENVRFQSEPFSALTLNAYISSCFNDFLIGDLVKLKRGTPRWTAMVTRALSHLLETNFIERVPGTQKHYQVTEETLAELF
jgi:hypothetical protein